MLISYPNLGHWVSPNWQFYDMPDRELIEWNDKFIKAGCNVIGGCCGMGPEVIEVM